MSESHVIDYESFLPRLVTGLKKTWEESRRQRPNETFYMFGIATDSDVVVLTPFCNTLEQYAIEGDPTYPIEKWVVPESGYDGSEYTNPLQDEINRYVFEDHSGESERAFKKRKARLLRIFEQSLKDLDREGFFGKGDDRHQVLLMIDRGDADESEFKYMLRAIKRLNPRRSRAEYFAALKAQRKAYNVERKTRQRKAKPVEALAIELLRREKRTFGRCTSVAPVRNEAMVPLLMKFLPETEAPGELWQVSFRQDDGPEGPGVIVVVVNPETGNCAVQE